MDCSHCGTPLSANSRFCPGCGLRVTPAAASVPDGEATVVVRAPVDPAGTVVVPVARLANPDDPPTTPLSVAADPALTVVVPAAVPEPLPGSAEFRANPTVVIRPAQHQARTMVIPPPPAAMADAPAEPEPVVDPEPELDRVFDSPPAIDPAPGSWTGDETVVVRAATVDAVPSPPDLDGTVVVPVHAPAAEPLPTWDGDATVVVSAYAPPPADPAGTVMVPVAPPLTAGDAAPAAAQAHDLSWTPEPEPATAPVDFASWAPAPPPAALEAWAAVNPPPQPAADDRTEDTRPVSPPSEGAPEPQAETPLPWFAAPMRTPEPPALSADATPAEPLPLPTDPPPVPVATAPPPEPPASPPPVPVATPEPAVPVAAAPAAAGNVPAPVSRPAASGSVMKLAGWVAALAVVGALGVVGARRYMAPAPEASAPPAPVAASSVEATCQTESSLKSTPGAGQATLQVTNKTTAPVVVHWLNLNGAREKWFEVSPGAMRNQRTPPTYKWVVARADGTCLAVISGQGSVVVE